MAMTKLTLSADAQVVKTAKRIAKARHTSVSAMFSRFLRSLAMSHTTETNPIGPITREASGMIKLSKGRSDRQLVEDALTAKYARRK